MAYSCHTQGQTMDFSLSPETLDFIASLSSTGRALNHRRFSIARPLQPRRPTRSSTYHESDHHLPTHSRRFSLATPPVLPPAPEKKQSSKTGLMDLPTEIVDQIISYALPCTSTSSTNEPVITVARKPDESPCTATDIETEAVRTKWTVKGYPAALFAVNHTISAIAFRRVWADCAVIVNLTSADALCFLKYALSERQRAAMRRVRFPRFMLSWRDPVGQDVWLNERMQAPAFIAEQEARLECEVVEQELVVIKPVRPSLSRMQSLVSHLQTRSSPALGLVC